jgi:ribosomal protein S18 acetylase RimI-like enzyme
MSDKIITREFSIGDYDPAVDLWKRVEGVEIAEGDDRESVSQFLLRNPGLSRVALDGEKIIGVAICGHDGRRGYIYHLAVDRDYEGRGIGRRLQDESLQGLRKAGIQRALILVAADNPRGRGFWRNCGWEENPEALSMGKDV